MSLSLLELSVKIIASQARRHKMPTDVIEQCLQAVFKTLQECQETVPPPVAAPVDTPAPNPQRSLLDTLRHTPRARVQPNCVYCLECGSALQLLSFRHLATHDLTHREYKRKWGLPLSMSLSARMITAKKRKQAQISKAVNRLQQSQPSLKPQFM
ncbi:MAG: hypothetical protein ETSY2_52455 [Candidatus Entotheonella gemina]|uniref:MucR family transcriptional regulator n=1 Tax=Candidatus Entotheonella gemina TaxID=1429439 RepID=W4L448_9BACT|nr:MAG: hypothetical protein ETSY2_52455 [Candidatus Entotheonella gemina]